MVIQEKDRKNINIICDKILHFSPSPDNFYFVKKKYRAYFYSKILSKWFNVTICDSKKLPLNTKTLAFVTLHHNILKYNDEGDLLTDALTSFFKKIATNVNNGKCLLLFDTCAWPFSTQNEKYTTLKLKIFLQIAGITNFNNVIIITSAHGADTSDSFIFKNVVFWEFFETVFKLHSTKTINFNKKIKNFYCNRAYRFLYLNNRERIHRLYLFIKIFSSVKNFYKHFAASMCPGDKLFVTDKERVALRDDTKQTYKAFLRNLLFFKAGTMPQWFYSSSCEEFLSNFSKLIQGHNVTTSLMPWDTNWKAPSIQWTTNKQPWEQIGIYIGTETNFIYDREKALKGNDYLTLTEKTFKPLLMKTPFILYGQPFILKKLKEYGFKTFSDYWDESYDEILDPALRADKIAEVVKKLSEISDEQFIDLLKKTRDIVEHNYKILMKRTPEQNLVNLITNFYNQKHG